MTRAVVAWSGGKDSALALYRILEQGIDVADLVSTVSAEHHRVSIHGVRTELLRRQAEEIGIPLRTVELPEGYSMDDYEEEMGRVFEEGREQGVDAVVYADIFLKEVRERREERLREAGLDGIWPLWGEDTQELAREFIDFGFRATLACVDAAELDSSFAGRSYDSSLLNELPDGVDPCGENGEFHTFVRDGPVFSSPVPVRKGAAVERPTGGSTTHYQDLVLGGER